MAQNWVFKGGFLEEWVPKEQAEVDYVTHNGRLSIFCLQLYFLLIPNLNQEPTLNIECALNIEGIQQMHLNEEKPKPSKENLILLPPTPQTQTLKGMQVTSFILIIVLLTTQMGDNTIKGQNKVSGRFLTPASQLGCGLNYIEYENKRMAELVHFLS